MAGKVGYFVDRAGTLGKLERTPQGGARVPANLARAGVMDYDSKVMANQGYDVPEALLDVGTCRIYLPEAVIVAALDSLADAPVTREHPAKMENTSNYAALSKGHTKGGSLKVVDGVLQGVLAIQDGVLLDDIDKGTRREVSLGYQAMTDFTPGVTPTGEAYDAVREWVEYNHTAIVTTARAGSKICLSLDSADIPLGDIIMLKINGVEVASEKAQAAVDGLEGALAAALAAAEDLKGKLKTATDSLALAESDEVLDSRIAKKAEEARLVQDRADKFAKVAAKFPKMVLDGKSDDFVFGIYETIVADAAEEQAGLDAIKNGGDQKVTDAKDEKPKLSARERMIAYNRSISTLPIVGNDRVPAKE